VDSLVQEPTIDFPAMDEVAEIVVTSDFDDFYRSRRDRVARALALTLGDAHLGAEAADEAMTRAYQRWARVGTYDDPGAWVYRVGLNWATSVLRRRNRPPRHTFESGHADIGPIAEPTVLHALADLPVAQRAVVICRFYLGLNEAETAAALHVRPGTVKSRLHRALAHLRTRLDHLSPEASND
jgi:RNA polymerase sigma-70 factor (ECF subfamily)